MRSQIRKVKTHSKNSAAVAEERVAVSERVNIRWLTRIKMSLGLNRLCNTEMTRVVVSLSLHTFSNSPHLAPPSHSGNMVGMVGVEISFVKWESSQVISYLISQYLISHSIRFTSHCPALTTSFLRIISLFDGDEGRKQLKHFLEKPCFSWRSDGILNLDIKSWFLIFTRVYCLHYHISCMWSDTQIFLFP